jgi:ATP-binding cassette, subfamily B, bacterial CvaB/MchF/RaxB
VSQTEAAECGLACLAMVAGYYGKRIDLPALRQQFSVSLRGTTLEHLIRFAARLDLTGRPLRVELEDLPQLSTPCILHFDMNHFVVLKKATSRRAIVYDPALGRRHFSMSSLSRHFTGVALELTPTPAFAPQEERSSLRLRDFFGKVSGIKTALAQVFLLAIALEVFSLISPLFLQLSVDRVIAHHNGPLLFSLGIGFSMLVVLLATLGSLRSWTTLYLGTQLKLQSYGRLFSHLLRLPVSWFEKRHFADIMSRFEGAEAIQRTLSNSFVEACLDGLVSVLALGVMLFYSRLLAAVVVGSVLLYLALRNLAYAPLRAATEKYIISLAWQQNHFIETLRGVRTIKVFGREDIRNSSWMNLLIATTNAQVSAEKLNILFKGANTLIFGLQSVLVVWLGVGRVLHNAMSVGAVFAFVMYQEQFKARTTLFVDRLFEFRMLSLQTQRLSDIVIEKPEIRTTEVQPAQEWNTGVEVKSLSFRYSDMDSWLLRDVSFHVQPGECVAIVGQSGAGKSTLLKLIAGLLRPQEGEIVIAGVSTADHSVSLAGRVGFVLQDDSLFAGTIAENISFASDTLDMQRVMECARLACLDREIEAMPMGYNSLVGDMGSALSGGQQQRLLLARALYPAPSILILDEATSHLDIPTERRITAMLADLGITRIFAAHRPDTIAIADRILTLEPSTGVYGPAITIRNYTGIGTDDASQVAVQMM